MYPNDLNPVFDMDKDKLKERLDASRENNKCKTHVIAKKYISMDKLEADNGKDIYFDRDYDTTDYDIIDKKFKEERKYLEEYFEAFWFSAKPALSVIRSSRE
jgi:hypothetical protein